MYNNTVGTGGRWGTRALFTGWDERRTFTVTLIWGTGGMGVSRRTNGRRERSGSTNPSGDHSEVKVKN